ncbi:MAG TPA: S53 family peptidase [Pirellulales bacterium]|nr:S53 family peptidase [Pirellulales bacterium]
MSPDYAVLKPHQTAGPTGFTPAQIRQAYGFNSITFPGGVKATGSGTTIAIVDAFSSPTIAADLKAFDAQFGIPDPPSFRIVNQNGSSNSAQLPPANADWSVEISLDVEWAHSIAPGASILLVETANNSTANLMAGDIYAKSQPGVVVVSNSWGGGEGLGESTLDSSFTTPSGHAPVQFVFSAGDTGAPASYPSASPNVLSVGGSSLKLTPNNSISSQVVWNDGPGDAGGGGESAIVNGVPLESVPNYQYQDTATNAGLLPTLTGRGTPDVSYNADPNTGFAVRDAAVFGATTPWEIIGGTSAGAPQWSALIAIADQGRALSGKGPLANIQSIVYKLPVADFHDIVTGNNIGNIAGQGYDLASGLGAPAANLVVSGLVAFNGSTVVTPTRPALSNSPGVFYFFAKSMATEGGSDVGAAAAIASTVDAGSGAFGADNALASGQYSDADFLADPSAMQATSLHYDDASLPFASDSSDEGALHHFHVLHDADANASSDALDNYFASM